MFQGIEREVTMSQKKPAVVRPQDESFEAYCNWIKGFYEQLTGKKWDSAVVSDEKLREEWEARRKRKAAK